MQDDYLGLLTWFLNSKCDYLAKEEPWNLQLLAKNIVHLYKSLDYSEEGFKDAIIKINSLENTFFCNDIDYLNPVLKLQMFVKNKLNDYVVDFLIHGSIATLDYSKGWSDLDTLVIINNKTLSSFNKLLELREYLSEARKYLFQIDKLQHHEFIYCTEYDLKRYKAHNMPIEVLIESRSLINSKSLEIKYDRNKSILVSNFLNKHNIIQKAWMKGELQHHKYKNNYLKENYQNKDCMYQLKYYLSLIMTLPTYYCDAIDKQTYKKHSFSMIREHFEDEWEIIDKASEIRSQWSLKEGINYTGNIIPDWVINILGFDYFYRGKKLSKAMVDKLVSHCK
jgi:predicted nucleotidyltransferase